MMDARSIPADARPAIIPKIEKPAALANIDEILELSDGMMVARGDLGVELGLHRVPFAQKFLIRKASTTATVTAQRATARAHGPMVALVELRVRTAPNAAWCTDRSLVAGERGGQVRDHRDADDGVDDHRRRAHARRGARSHHRVPMPSSALRASSLRSRLASLYDADCRR